MKTLLLFLGILLALNTQATHWMTYYVYTEKEYAQGPWARDQLLETSGFRYLEPKAYEDLMGSETEDLMHLLIKRLKQSNYEAYNWSYDLAYQADTIILTPKGEIQQLETVQNEITTTALLNNFKAVIFKFAGQTDTLTLADVTIPYFDLVDPSTTTEPPAKTESTTPPTTPQKEPTQTNPAPQPTNPSETIPLENGSTTHWLILFLGLNIALLLILIFRRRR